jgi:ribosomal protein L28
MNVPFLTVWLNKKRQIFCTIIMQTIASWWTQNTLATQIWVSAHTLRNASFKKNYHRITEKHLKQKMRTKIALTDIISVSTQPHYAPRALTPDNKHTFWNVQLKVTTSFLTPLHVYMLGIILMIQDSKFPNESSIQSGIF